MHQSSAFFRISIMQQTPSADLYDRVISRINHEEKLRLLKRRLILRSSGLILSFFAFIPLSFRLIADIAESGFTQFLSLLFSDFYVVMANIGDYALSLLELTPTLSLSLALAALLALLFYLAKLADSYGDFKKIYIN